MATILNFVANLLWVLADYLLAMTSAISSAVSLYETSYCRVLLKKLDILKKEFELPFPNLELLRDHVDGLEIYVGFLWGNFQDVYYALANAAENRENEEVCGILKAEWRDIEDQLAVLCDAEDRLGMLS